MTETEGLIERPTDVIGQLEYEINRGGNSATINAMIAALDALLEAKKQFEFYGTQHAITLFAKLTARAERAERELADAVAKENEECAKILDRREEMETQMSKRHANNGKHFKAREAAHVARIAKSDAAAIRARSNAND